MKLFNFNARNIVVSAVVSVIIICIGYKYYEWDTLQNLSALYDQTWTQELGQVQNSNKNSQAYTQLEQKVFGKNAPIDSIINSYNELSGDLQAHISSQDDYSTMIEQNSTQYAGFN